MTTAALYRFHRDTAGHATKMSMFRARVGQVSTVTPIGEVDYRELSTARANHVQKAVNLLSRRSDVCKFRSNNCISVGALLRDRESVRLGENSHVYVRDHKGGNYTCLLYTSDAADE
eukprot:TRINITY_DN171_c2_g2_i1.p1 TRINITY_DN171_c2_g2~~TRINITY_DN171_c2_g2_i1.p1  ORF type:complete len:117 (-),score=3.46 TRINITY_DN171_c2_g2_i1:11-361(-)